MTEMFQTPEMKIHSFGTKASSEIVKYIVASEL